jgi:hypothetical protein
MGLYNPFSQGDQAQEAGTALQNIQGNMASQKVLENSFNYPYPSSPSSPSSPYQYYNMNYQGESSGGGILSNLIHNKYFLIGAVVFILIIIGIILMR